MVCNCGPALCALLCFVWLQLCLGAPVCLSKSRQPLANGARPFVRATAASVKGGRVSIVLVCAHFSQGPLYLPHALTRALSHREAAARQQQIN